MKLPRSDRPGVGIPTIRGVILAVGLVAAVLIAQHSRADHDAAMVPILENLRANERLFADLEVIVEQDFQLHNPPSVDAGAYQSLNKRNRYVYQRGMVYHKSDIRGVDQADNVTTPNYLIGFDGAKTRIVAQDAVANVEDGPSRHLQTLYRPHSLMIRHIWYPLSDYLAGSPTTRRYHTDLVIDTRLVSEEEVDGLRCVKVERRSIRDGFDKGGSVSFIWLAVDRCYFPVKIVGYMGDPECDGWDHTGYNPVETATAGDFREIAPGIWFPFALDHQIFDGWFTRPGTTPRLTGVERVRVEKAVLDPDYDVSLFRDIAIPDTAINYHLDRDGKITGAERPKAPDPRAAGRSRWLNWVIGAGLATVCLFVGRSTWRRMRR